MGRFGRQQDGPPTGGREAGQNKMCERTECSPGRFRLRVGLTTLMVGLAAVWGWDYLQGEQALATTPLRQVTVSSIAQRVQKARGQILILTLYRPSADDDPYVAADLRRWAVQTRNPHVEFLGVAVGSRRDAQLLFRYGTDAGVQRLPPDWLPAVESATLDSALATLGLPRTASDSLPLTAVFDRDGGVAGQWRGDLDYVSVLSAAKAASRR